MAIRMTHQINRRYFATLAGGFLLSAKAVAQTETPLLTRSIPSSGERIPAVGLGTAYVFDENNEATRSNADAVVQAHQEWRTAHRHGINLRRCGKRAGRGYSNCRLARQSGSIHFADIDLTDRPTATITSQSVTWTAAAHTTDLSSSLSHRELKMEIHLTLSAFCTEGSRGGRAPPVSCVFYRY